VIRSATLALAIVMAAQTASAQQSGALSNYDALASPAAEEPSALDRTYELAPAPQARPRENTPVPSTATDYTAGTHLTHSASPAPRPAATDYQTTVPSSLTRAPLDIRPSSMQCPRWRIALCLLLLTR
jgi:hypothetical protein